MANATAITIVDLDAAEVSAALTTATPGDVFDTGQVAVTVPILITHDTNGVLLRIHSKGTGALTAEVLKGTNANSLLASKGNVSATIAIGSVTPQTKYIRLDDPARHLISDGSNKGFINLKLTPAQGTTIVAWVECIKLNKPR